MRCPSCDHDNRRERRFCAKCGAALAAPLPFVVGIVGTALLLLMRAAHWHLARCNYLASLLLAFWSTPYFMVPTAPRAELISDVLVLPLGCGLFLWDLNEFLLGVRLWGRGQRAVTWALALLSSASRPT